MKRYETIFCIVVAVIGGGLLAHGFYRIHQTLKFLDRCLETKGVVIDCAGQDRRFPVFQFVDNRTGKVITVHSSVGGGCPVGAEVDVLYDPENPHNATIKSFEHIWGAICMFNIFPSVCILLFGLIPLFYAYVRRKRRSMRALRVTFPTLLASTDTRDTVGIAIFCPTLLSLSQFPFCL